MKKKKSTKSCELGRGTIYHSALGALVTSTIFKMRVETPQKGKGSYSRKIKNSNISYSELD